MPALGAGDADDGGSFSRYGNRVAAAFARYDFKFGLRRSPFGIHGCIPRYTNIRSRNVRS